jgi:hypothetical protein
VSQVLFNAPDLITFVFSTVLFERPDWHLNLQDQNGYANQYSFGPTTLALRESVHQKYLKAGLNFLYNEVIFQHPVSLDFIQSVWIVAPNQKTWFQQLYQVLKMLTDMAVDKKIFDDDCDSTNDGSTHGGDFLDLNVVQKLTRLPRKIWTCGSDNFIAKLVRSGLIKFQIHYSIKDV